MPAIFGLQMAETQFKMAEAEERKKDDLTGRDKWLQLAAQTM